MNLIADFDVMSAPPTRFLSQEEVLHERARMLSIEKRCATRVVRRTVEFMDENGEWKELKG